MNLELTLNKMSLCGILLLSQFCCSIILLFYNFFTTLLGVKRIGWIGREVTEGQKKRGDERGIRIRRENGRGEGRKEGKGQRDGTEGKRVNSSPPPFPSPPKNKRMIIIKHTNVHSIKFYLNKSIVCRTIHSQSCELHFLC